MNRRALLSLLLASPVAVAAEVAKLAVVSPTAPPATRRHRISADPKDPAYDPLAVGLVEIYFNGQKTNNCITADEELGTVLCFGQSFDKRRPWDYHELKGRVQIIYLKGHTLNPHREDD